VCKLELDVGIHASEVKGTCQDHFRHWLNILSSCDRVIRSSPALRFPTLLSVESLTGNFEPGGDRVEVCVVELL
jgi:hypothetical protein